ncbi:MAG: toll/interleukin-1 receptor domain-containing protein [Anaerolineae bacterium]|nr:toll/interleukin-1 receptor domain-containing protein [Anaerolineae bacterium]
MPRKPKSAKSANPDPRTLKPPTIFVERIDAFARDLAYGARVGDWTPALWIDASLPQQEFWSSDGAPMCSANLANYLDTKWPYDEEANQFSHPTYSFLEAWGYFTYKYSSESGSAKCFLLTPKAFALLEKPAAPPAVFISYARKDGGVFALLIEARLRLVGLPNPFVDKNLVPGETWQSVLRDRIYGCQYFVCIVGPESLGSVHVQKEIEWALAAGCTVISIWHGTTVDEIAPGIKQLSAYRELSTRQIITVKGSTADDYESAVNKLLNAMGYPTY